MRWTVLRLPPGRALFRDSYRIACVKGIAIALANGIGVCSLEIPAWQVLGEGRIGVTVIDARRGEVYLAGYRKIDGLTEQMVGPRLVKADTLASFMADMPLGLLL